MESAERTESSHAWL